MSGLGTAETRAGASFVPLYRRVLGADLDRLPPAVRQLHDHGGSLSAAGVCRVERGEAVLARLVAAFFRLPPAGSELPVRVSFEAVAGTEIRQRDFAGHPLTSRQGVLPGQPRWLYERFAAGRFKIEPKVTPEGIELLLRGAAFLGIPLPRFLWPDIVGRESVDERGRFTFFVTIHLPFIGLLVHYHGYLVPEGQEL